MDRIDRDCGREGRLRWNLSVWPLQDSNGSHVPIGVAIKNHNRANYRNKCFSVDRINGHLVRVCNFNVWTMDGANGGFVSVGPTAVRHDRLGMKLSHHDLVFDRIVSKSMDIPRNLSILT